MTPRWFEVPADDIALHADSDHLAECLRLRSSRYAAHAGRWDLCTVAGGWGVNTAATSSRPLYPVRSSGRYTPKVSRAPWRKGTRVPNGGDGCVQLTDPTTGQQWGYARPLLINSVLWVSDAWTVTAPALDAKGRVCAGAPVDMRTYRGNHPASNGAGVIPRPVTRADLEARRIPRALSCYAASECFGPDGLVVAPASKVENGVKGPSAGGVRWSWRFDDADLDGLDLAPGVRTIANALREFGATVDMTGPNAGIICADVDLPRDGLAKVLDRVEWVVHEPPVGYRFGAVVDGIGHCDDFTYR